MKFSRERWEKVHKSIKIWELDEVVNFGKYRGATIRQLIDREPKYLLYLDLELSNEAFEYLKTGECYDHFS